MSDYTEGRWWDSGSWWRWRLVRPVGWHLAGLRDWLTLNRQDCKGEDE